MFSIQKVLKKIGQDLASAFSTLTTHTNDIATQQGEINGLTTFKNRFYTARQNKVVNVNVHDGVCYRSSGFAVTIPSGQYDYINVVVKGDNEFWVGIDKYNATTGTMTVVVWSSNSYTNQSITLDVFAIKQVGG